MKNEYPASSRRDDAPTPWDSRWWFARTTPFDSRSMRIARSLVAISAAVGVILIADLLFTGAVVGLVGVAAMVLALAFCRF
ncbi:MAG: hypothetical protein ACRDL0_09960 [Thermoleophilaceae bacterium]